MELTHESVTAARIQALEIVMNQIAAGLAGNPDTKDMAKHIRMTVLQAVMDENDRLERDDHSAEFRMRYGAEVFANIQKLLSVNPGTF